MSLVAAKKKLSAWQIEYDTGRPHSTLGCRSPIKGESKAINEEATAA
jgi:hypothetical protein